MAISSSIDDQTRSAELRSMLKHGFADLSLGPEPTTPSSFSDFDWETILAKDWYAFGPDEFAKYDDLLSVAAPRTWIWLIPRALAAIILHGRDMERVRVIGEVLEWPASNRSEWVKAHSSGLISDKQFDILLRACQFIRTSARINIFSKFDTALFEDEISVLVSVISEEA